MAEVTADVYVQISGEDVFAGRLWASRRGRTESTTFAYDAGYLKHPGRYELDPRLPLHTGPSRPAVNQILFGAFSDCAPDRWGRRLLTRAEEQRVDSAGTGAAKRLGEVDFLLGVRDAQRQGALRFRDPGTGAWLADDDGIPHVLELPDLLSASARMERDEATAAELRALLRGGSSLGGARPKARVLANDGRVTIAKFPSPAVDDWDVIRWEAITNVLAGRAGIDAARAELISVESKAVLLVDRFDRDAERRIGYVSAMTMLEAVDGNDGHSYLDIAGAIEEQSPSTTSDLRELWRRIVFSILVRNTDDHLRNHGFLRTSSAGWTLAPAFDLNPNPEPGPARLSLAIDDRTDEARLDVAFEVAGYFRLGDDEARRIVRDVAAAVATWRREADRHGATHSDIQRMARAFEHAETTVAAAA